MFRLLNSSSEITFPLAFFITKLSQLVVIDVSVTSFADMDAEASAV